MKLETAIVAALIAAGDVTSITQLFIPGYAPQRETYPYIVYEISGRENDLTYGGPSGLANNTVKLRCIDKTYLGAASLGMAVVDDLDNSSGTFGGVKVQGIFLKDETDDQFTNPINENMTLYSRDVTFEVWWNDDDDDAGE